MFADLEVKPEDYAEQGGKQSKATRQEGGVSKMHKYGSVVSGRVQVISRREKRELKKSFKKREDGTRGIKVGIESFRRIAVSDKYNHVWERSERYTHFKYMANKLQ